MGNDIVVEATPDHHISSLCFVGPEQENSLAVGCWDKKLRIYRADDGALQVVTQVSDGILGMATVVESETVGIACIDGSIQRVNVENSAITNLGRHSEAASKICYNSSHRLLISGSWDKSLKYWDDREPSPKPCNEITLHGKIFALDSIGNRVVVGDSLRRIYIYDIRKLSGDRPLEEYRDLVQQYQYRCIRCFPDGTGFAASSIEGRVAWEYFGSDATNKSKSYAFKCHRLKQADGSEIVHPVHALAFNKLYNTFATGGGEGGVMIWDGHAKKRLTKKPELPTSIVSLEFNSSSSRLAVAASYAWESGPKQIVPENKLVFFAIADSDIAPKSAIFNS